jgi:RimJ/RimL family protein N-acetyltransferase
VNAPPDRDPPFDGNPSWRVVRTLKDGTEVAIRPIVPEDREELRRAFRATSTRTRYLRFLAVLGELSDDMLDYLTRVDQKDHVALVAVHASPDLKSERGVGIARFIRLEDEPHIAEAAITVADDFQRRGLGTVLGRELARSAQAHDIRTIRAEVLEGNERMRAILEGAGAKHRGTSDGIVSYDIDIEPGTFVHRLRHVMRGAAQTMAMTIRRLAPPSAATASEREAKRPEREHE